MVETIFMLLAFVAFTVAFERARLGGIVGLLVAGAVIGPHGVALIGEVELIDILAELGIVSLLFTVGLEIKLDRLRLYGVDTYLLAIAQLVVTTAAGAALARSLGAGPNGSLVIGLALAFSSTALVLQVLADLGRTLTHLGRLAIAILLIQDLGVGPALIILQAMTPIGGQEAHMLVTLAWIVGVIVTIVLAGHFILPALLKFVSGTGREELFLALVLVVVLGASFALEAVGGSAAIGAFLVGLLAADTPYRHQIAADIAPFRGLLVGVFFMAVGMNADLGLLADHAGSVVMVAIAIVLGKALILFALARAFGNPTRLSAEVGILLSQGSEFSFIIFGAATAAFIMPANLAGLLVVSVALSMAVIPLVASAARGLIDRTEGQAVASPSEIERASTEFHDHVVVVGFGQVGMALTRHLRGLGLPVLVIDYNAGRVRSTRAHGLPVYYGNATRSEVLRSCHVEQASLVVVAVPDDEVAGRIVEMVHRLFPDVPILVRTSTGERAPQLLAAGADGVVPDGLTTALDLAERAVLMVDMPSETAEAAKEA